MILSILKVTVTGISQQMGCDPGSIRNSFRKEPLFLCSYHQGDFYFPPYRTGLRNKSGVLFQFLF